MGGAAQHTISRDSADGPAWKRYTPAPQSAIADAQLPIELMATAKSNTANLRSRRDA
jgi:hypothetical protein